VLDASQNVVASYEYDEFGVETGNYTLDQPYRFSTKRYYDGIGINYYGYRFYAASLGRWMTRDPLGETGGMNLYGFVGNGPMNAVDPWGLAYYNIEESTAFWEQYAVNGLEQGGLIGSSKGIIGASMNAFIEFWGAQAIANNSRIAGNADCSTGQRLWAGTKVIGQIALSSGGLEAGASWLGRPFWRYMGQGSNPLSKWLTRGWGWAAPYGDDFARAAGEMQIPLERTGPITNVNPVEVPWYKPVVGPRSATAHPEWGVGGGPEYYQGWRFPE
jgi:RHS repeat-associated protein